MRCAKFCSLIIGVILLGCGQQKKFGGGDGYTTTSSGLKYKIIKNGEGRAARVGDEILLRETTSYRNGTVLYSNETSGGPVKVLIGGNQATKAVDEGLRGMRIGEIREIIAAPHLVKRTGYPPNVSPDSTLVIKMILHDILKK